MRRELEEQLGRCKDWLKIEPNDEEVKEKVKELEGKIREIDEKEEREEYEKIKNEKYERIMELEKEIKRMKRDMNMRVPILDGYEEMSEQLRVIKDFVNIGMIGVVNKKIEEHNRLVMEYEKEYR